jgi:dTDP-4-amino-4,6-dideoxygalactose transaminase
MNKIRLSKSTIGNEEKNAVLSVLDKEFLGMGEEVNLFEQEIKTYLNTEHEVICVNTGTSALHLAIEALNLSEDSEILVPSLTYVASFQAISAANVKPIAVEVCEDTLFIDLDDAKTKLTSKTKAIMPIHYASNSKDIQAVYTFAKDNNLRVIEDAAQAFGCQNNMGKVGTAGDIICFSFDGIKNITSGEGGAVVTSDKEVVQRVKDARLLGVEKDTDKRFKGQRSWDFDVKHQGYRYHMSNIFAAIGREQLKKVNTIEEKRKNIVNYYLNNLDDVSQIKFLDFDYEDIISHIFVIKVSRRNELRDYLLSKNIECGIHYKPNHLLTKYKTKFSLPITEKVYDEILTLPCQIYLTSDELDYVTNTIKEFFNA